MNHRFVAVVCSAALAGCATLGSGGAPKVQVLGVRAPLLSADKLVESVYFTHLDDKELHSAFNQYPASIETTPGPHNVTVVCEWRASGSAPPVAKHVKRYKEEFVVGQMYRFTSTYADAGLCQTHMETVTVSEPTAAPVRTNK